jgi:hypothetical protein
MPEIGTSGLMSEDRKRSVATWPKPPRLSSTLLSCTALRVTMIFKIIAFIAAAIPIFLFVRSIFFRRTTRMNEGLREFKKQANLAVSIFLFLIVCVVVFAAGKLAWTWWSSL